MTTMCMERALRRCPPWSELPKELLHVIQTKLRDIFDFVRFRCVCKSWMSAGGRSYLFPGQQFPWLMLPYDPDSVERSFYSFSTRSVHVLRLPEARDRITLSSANGWLLLLDRSCFNISFLHPLTRHLIRLPPPPSHFDLTLSTYAYRCFWLDGVAAFVVGDRPEFVYWKADGGWSQVHSGMQEPIEDVAYHKGQFYVTTDFSLSVCPPRAGAVGRVVESLALPAPLLFSVLLSYGEDLLLLACSKDRGISFFRLEESAANAMHWSSISPIAMADFSLFVTEANYAFVNASGDGSQKIYAPRAFTMQEDSRTYQKCDMTMLEDGVLKGVFDLCETPRKDLLKDLVLLTPNLSISPFDGCRL